MRLDPELEKLIATDAEATYDVIVRVNGDPAECEAQLQADGFDIKRRFRLIRGFAASATGANISKAAQRDWVVAIEPDREVKTMP